VDELLAVWRNARNQVTPFTGVDEVLRELRRMGLKIVTLTNGNCQAATVPILAEVCEFHLNVDSCGTAKPDPAMIQLMLDTLGVEPAQVVHVGDDLVADVSGAARLGIVTIWTDYAHKLYDVSEESAESIAETREGGIGLVLPGGARSLGDQVQIEASVLAAQAAAHNPRIDQSDAVVHSIYDLPLVMRRWIESVERENSA
jgi:HAD superfamily hydrolase (TIGR01509 family)